MVFTTLQFYNIWISRNCLGQTNRVLYQKIKKLAKSMTKRKISSSQMSRSGAQNQPIDEKQNSLKRMSTMRKQYTLRRQQTLQQQQDMKRNKQVRKEVEKGLDGFDKFQGKYLYYA